MSGRHTGYRNRRPRSEPACTPIFTDPRATMAFEADALAVAAAPEPQDCPACEGRATGCGTCGGRGWLAGDEWKLALQRLFVSACGLVLPCEAEGGEAA